MTRRWCYVGIAVVLSLALGGRHARLCVHAGPRKGGPGAYGRTDRGRAERHPRNSDRPGLRSIQRPYRRLERRPELAFYVCGWVNSKNRFGGYAGRQAFLATLSGQRTETEPYRLKVYQLHEFSDHTTGLCRRIGLDMAAGGGTGR